MGTLPKPPFGSPATGRRVMLLNIRAFVVAVMGSVLANYITKCLDWLITLIFG